MHWCKTETGLNHFYRKYHQLGKMGGYHLAGVQTDRPPPFIRPTGVTEVLFADLSDLVEAGVQV